MNYTIKTGQTVFDVVVEVYGTLEFLEKFLSDNSTLSAASTLSSGDTVKIDSGLLDQRLSFTMNNADYYDGESTGAPQSPVYVAPLAQRSNKTYVEPGQSIYDLTEQLYGDMNLLNKMLSANGWSYDTFLTPGDEVVVDESLRRKDYVYARETKTVYNNSDFWPAEIVGPAGDFIIDHQDNILDTDQEENMIHDNGK